MLSCYIIDDEPHAIKSLRSLIEKAASLKLMGVNSNPLSALDEFQKQDHYPDITFLDIEMPEISGIDISLLLQGKTQVVFTTAHPGFAVTAFGMDVIDFLLKPVSLARFMQCINRVEDRMTQKNRREERDNFFFIQTECKGKLIKINFDEVLYIESQKNYVSIVTFSKKHLTYLTLSEIETRLPSAFLRISKSFIVNTLNISRIEGNEIFLENHELSLLIGSSFKEDFSRFMQSHVIKTKRYGQ